MDERGWVGNEDTLQGTNPFRFERAIKRGGPEIVPWRAVWLELGLGP